MTLKQFERYVQKGNPNIRLRIRGYGDIGGVFKGKSAKQGYLARISKGELTMSGYRMEIVDPTNKMKMTRGNIAKRGRKTLLLLMRSWGLLRGHKNISRPLWGIKD